MWQGQSYVYSRCAPTAPLYSSVRIATLASNREGSPGFDLNQKMTHTLGLPALLLGGRHLRSTRFLPPSREVAAETKASQEVMDLVRLHRELGLLVIQLRDAGRPWSQVKAVIEARIKSALDDR